MPPSVLWFRRDLRLADNPALLAALDDAGNDAAVALFVLDDALLRPAGANRRAFLYRTLRCLDEALGGRLVVRRGRPSDIVPSVVAEVGASSVHAAADFGPYGRRRDDDVERALSVPLVRTGSAYAVEPGAIRKTDGTPFKVFTPYLRAWQTRRIAPPADAPRDARWIDGLATEPVPDDPHGVSPCLPDAGETAAHRRLAAFAERLAGYAAARDRPGDDATSRLSVDLKYGALHPRQLLHAVGPVRSASATKFRSELAWRDFYADVLWHRPESARQALQPVMRDLAYDDGPEANERFAAWAEGRTGFPIVDAGMRQLAAEGWMHNRVRMLTASFLTKDLHVDWRRGARFFLDRLVDGDLASNQHGWQWVAGTGTDPSPYHRVFNPTVQAERFDPDGAYVRRYVPEVGTDRYPPPVVDHDVERREALARYAAAKRQSS
jgi:deoxyribodipyrimidine photo-lyase